MACLQILPPELLCLIFDSIEDAAVINELRSSCKALHNALLTQVNRHVLLNAIRLEKFPPVAHSGFRALIKSQVRSLHINLNHGDFRIAPTTRERLPWARNVMALASYLELLKPKELSHVNFQVRPDDTNMVVNESLRGTYAYQGVIHQFVKAFPGKYLTRLTMDLHEMPHEGNYGEETSHICTAIYSQLRTVQYLKLRLPRICRAAYQVSNWEPNQLRKVSINTVIKCLPNGDVTATSKCCDAPRHRDVRVCLGRAMDIVILHAAHLQHLELIQWRRSADELAPHVESYNYRRRAKKSKYFTKHSFEQWKAWDSMVLE